MRRPAAPLRRWSVIGHVMVLVAAWAWAAAVLAFYYGYHFAKPSSPWMIYNGRTYYTHPPAQTLAQSDHVSAEIVTIALGLALIMGTLDLIARLVRRMPVLGVAAIIGGGLLMVFSLFGLLRGLAGIGTAGLLLILTGIPLRSTAGANSTPTVRALPASWYADPMGRYDLRYWDGFSWSPHVSAQGRPFVDPL